MRLVLFLFLTSAFWGGCKTEPPGRSDPQSAFARLAPCINKQDAKCIYSELDRDSRWSVQTIYKTMVQMRTLVESTYPQERQKEAYGTFSSMSSSTSDADLFERFCLSQNCLETISQGFGAVVKTEPQTDILVQVTTTRKAAFAMSLADGQWGLSIYQKQLQDAKIRLLDRHEQVKKNAAAFRETRAAIEK